MSGWLAVVRAFKWVQWVWGADAEERGPRVAVACCLAELLRPVYVVLCGGGQDLMTLATLVKGEVEVTRGGDLLYTFPQDFRAVLRTRSVLQQAKEVGDCTVCQQENVDALC